MGWSLNLGSGERPMRAMNGHPCINIDTRDLSDNEKYKEAVFIRGDVTKLPFTDERFKVILASDIVEHFPKTSTKNLIKEWVRVLKKGGLILFRTPSLKWVAGYYAKTGDAEFVSHHIFGGQGYAENFHYVIFDKKWLEKICNEFGLVTTDYKENESNFELTMEKL